MARIEISGNGSQARGIWDLALCTTNGRVEDFVSTTRGCAASASVGFRDSGDWVNIPEIERHVLVNEVSFSVVERLMRHYSNARDLAAATRVEVCDVIRHVAEAASRQTASVEPRYTPRSPLRGFEFMQ